MSATTLKEVAKQAHVTEVTVCNVLTGRYQPKTERGRCNAERIKALADTMGYRRNSAAKAMATGRFHCLALLLSTTSSRSILPPGLLAGIQDALNEEGQHLVVCSLPDEKLTSEGYVPRILTELMADGLLINYNSAIPAAMVQLIENHHIPSVWINYKREMNAVYPDDFGAAVTATRRLLELGHRRIVYLDFAHLSLASAAHYSGVDRYQGYVEEMGRAGLEPRRFGSPVLRDEGRIASSVAELLAGSEAPTAVLCYSPLCARAGVAGAYLAGKHIPDDLSIIVFAEEVTNDLGPKLATILLPEETMGRMAVDMLSRRLEHPGRDLPALPMSMRLVEGQTLRAAPVEHAHLPSDLSRSPQ